MASRRSAGATALAVAMAWPASLPAAADPAAPLILHLDAAEHSACAALARQVVGLDLRAAQRMARKRQLPWRVVRDGAGERVRTMDLRADRLNLVLVRGRVRSAHCG